MSSHSLRVTILIDNSAPLPTRFLPEYGFSALIEDFEAGVKVLFDTGTSGDVLLKNLGVAGINPLDIDYVVLSHRHYDHTGGLRKLLEARRGKPITVIAHPDLFVPAYTNLLGGMLRDIGAPFTRSEIEAMGARLLLSRDPVQVTPSVRTMGEIDRGHGPSHTRGMLRVEKGRLVEDSLLDDTGLLLHIDKGVVVLTGCGHSGIENIIEHASRLSGEDVYGVIGGLHLLGATDDRIVEVAGYLSSKGLGLVAAGHCTGPLAQWVLREKNPSAYRLLGVGMEFSF
ncbi:MAG: MBL fold metallo-hydrolase [Desulfurococcales archaeon]|nr:MBL fold metallo-hydrolase [Desulfurococcales archaeon]